jgi:hypothetical protein
LRRAVETDDPPRQVVPKETRYRSASCVLPVQRAVEHGQGQHEHMVLARAISCLFELPVVIVEQFHTLAYRLFILEPELVGEEPGIDVHRLGRGRVQVEVPGEVAHRAGQ